METRNLATPMWKRKAEKFLINLCQSKVGAMSYTIIHPGGLIDKPGGEREIVFGVDDDLLKRRCVTSHGRMWLQSVRPSRMRRRKIVLSILSARVQKKQQRQHVISMHFFRHPGIAFTRNEYSQPQRFACR